MILIFHRFHIKLAVSILYCVKPAMIWYFAMLCVSLATASVTNSEKCKSRRKSWPCNILYTWDSTSVLGVLLTYLWSSFLAVNSTFCLISSLKKFYDLIRNSKFEAVVVFVSSIWAQRVASVCYTKRLFSLSSSSLSFNVCLFLLVFTSLRSFLIAILIILVLFWHASSITISAALVIISILSVRDIRNLFSWLSILLIEHLMSVCVCVTKIWNENVSRKFLNSTRLDLRKIGTKGTYIEKNSRFWAFILVQKGRT